MNTLTIPGSPNTRNGHVNGHLQQDEGRVYSLLTTVKNNDNVRQHLEQNRLYSNNNESGVIVYTRSIN